MRMILIMILAANSLLLTVIQPEVGFALPKAEIGFLTVDLSVLPIAEIFFAAILLNAVAGLYLLAVEFFYKIKQKNKQKNEQEVTAD